ncbi:toll/interleukin-1 receptor domain-containing protein [Methyloceanibacter methanicus]|uniref:toll/interleukin-1 receptor domain-containing protein n=1 Tax=Methyloceanibacter methanicus TaxID=1774968 RepID=UPI0009F701C1
MSLAARRAVKTQHPSDDGVVPGGLFISHAAEDKDFALWIGARLSAAGYDVWADVLSLKGGDDWARIWSKHFAPSLGRCSSSRPAKASRSRA